MVWNDCRCTLRGYAWLADDPDGEAEAKEVWSTHSDPEFALEAWVKRVNASRDYEAFRDGDARVVAFRPVGGGPLQFVIVYAELALEYQLVESEKFDNEVQAARSSCARSHRSRRKWERERAALKAMKQQNDDPEPAQSG